VAAPLGDSAAGVWNPERWLRRRSLIEVWEWKDLPAKQVGRMCLGVGAGLLLKDYRKKHTAFIHSYLRISVTNLI